MAAQDTKHTAWFLGPKAENGQFLENAILTILRDYIHWRRNYYPGDATLIDQPLQRRLEEEYDFVSQNAAELASELRRNFPFYSPRYIGHQLSDTTIPAIIGYLAGMLYNPNNVTPEAAPVTVDLEIQACNEILKMLGYNAPPSPEEPPKPRREFGWAHITMGGTSANIEALWVARNVRYFPLSARELAIREGLEIPIHLPQPAGSGEAQLKDLRDYEEHEVFLIRPNEAVYLLAYCVDAIRRKRGISAEDAGREAWKLLKESEYSLGKGTGSAFSRYPPVIFASGAARYSIGKAANVLGIGRDNVVPVKTDAMFRLDMSDLETRIRRSIREGKVPLAVVAIAGTTEEGAVDPVHEIGDLRQRLEESGTASFWLHIDAAWGGYLRTLFRDPDAARSSISEKLKILNVIDPSAWNDVLFARLDKIAQEHQLSESTRLEILSHQDRLRRLAVGDYDRFISEVKTILLRAAREVGGADTSERLVTKRDFAPPLQSRIEMVNDFVSDRIQLSLGNYGTGVTVKWGSRDVCSAFMAFGRADSITIDPHKLGYLPYPCGVVAFRNDRIRHLIRQEAPYISIAEQDVLVHIPPKHPQRTGTGDLPSEWDGTRVAIDAFAPFIMEGSRSGASASSLWLSTKTIPLFQHAHGAIVRSTLLAARELYEWLVHWDRIIEESMDHYYNFIPLTVHPPDTNIVIFAVKKRNSSSLALMNSLTRSVYERFSIQTELGAREYSYSQPFFLSRTRCFDESYPSDSLDNFFKRCGLKRASQDYRQSGLEVLRATVMNPYIQPLRASTGQNLVKEFVIELARSTEQALTRIDNGQ